MKSKRFFCFNTFIFAALFLSLFCFASPALAERAKPSPSGNELAPRAVVPKPPVTRINPDAEVSHMVVKFKDDSEVRYRGGSLVSMRGTSVHEAEVVLSPYLNTRFRRLFQSLPEARLDRDRQALQLKAERQLADLNSYYRIEVSSPAEAEQIVNDLNALNMIEIAYFEPMPEPADDIPPPTPDYQPNQDYREAAPDGVDADYANTLPGGDGSGVMIIDIEGNWQTTHEDLDKAVGGIIAGDPIDNPSWRNHGTAVIGEMIAGDNGYGVTGICPGADIGMISIGGWSTAEALYAAIDTLQQGDMILIELHAPGPRYDFQSRPDQLGYVCMEYWQANYDAIQYAWAKGIVVIEAGGNGAEDFDDPIYGPLFDTTYRNSHAIIVGAGYPAASSNDLQKHGFSNYGARVNLQGYGSGVYTTGYGGLFDGDGDENQYYTATFGGTSSASPIVTGAAACLQGYYLATYGPPLTSDRIRDVLVATGTLQKGDTSQHIGPRPDLQAAIAILTTPPSLYVRPILIDTTVSEGDLGVVELWIINLSATSAFDFSIVDNDSLAKFVEENWLVASPQNGSVLPSDSVKVDVTLDATVIEDRVETYAGVLEISWGPSGGSLDSLILVPAFLEVPCNDATYKATSSDEPEGPTYNWISAKDMGSKISYNAFSGYNPLDDGTAGPFGIGFDFWYYDTSYTKLHIGVNGAISFSDDDLSVGGYFSSLDLPGAPFATFVAPFWNDLVFDTAVVPQSGAYLYRSQQLDTCVIEWYHVSNFNDPNDTMTNFEVVLTIDGNILFQYKDVGASGLEQTALIGISEEGCRALSHFDDGDIPENEVSGAEAVLIENTTRVWTQSGDMDGWPGTNVADLAYLVEYLFFEGPAPDPLESGNVDCLGETNVGDLTYLVEYLFFGGPAPCYFWLYL